MAVTGRSGVGKTALVNHASCGDWVGSFPETLGTCVTRVSPPSSSSSSNDNAGDSTSSSSVECYYDLWEVGGRYAAKFPYAVKAQLKAARVIVHVFSFADRASLQSVPKEVANFRTGHGEDGGAPPAIVLVGTKRDCVSSCQLSVEEAKSVAAECNVPLVLIDSPPLEPDDHGGRIHNAGSDAAAMPPFLLFEALKAATTTNRG